jgi:hypothetical protein
VYPDGTTRSSDIRNSLARSRLDQASAKIDEETVELSQFRGRLRAPFFHDARLVAQEMSHDRLGAAHRQEDAFVQPEICRVMATKRIDNGTV